MSLDVVRANDRRYTEFGLPVSVPRPASPSVLPVHRLVKVIGAPGVGVPLVGESTGWRWGRLCVHAIGTFVCLLALSLALLAVVPSAFGYQPIVVASGSMAPALRTSDVVVAKNPTEQLVVGAVIDFDAGAGSRIHRIVEITDAGYRTQGDANPTPDPELVVDDEIHGVGVMVVPFVGAVRLWVDEGRWLQLFALSVVLVGAAWVAPRRWLNRSNQPGGPAGVLR